MLNINGKTHPKQVILAEPEGLVSWRVVARETTRNGYRSGPMLPIVSGISKEQASAVVQQLKKGIVL